MHRAVDSPKNAHMNCSACKNRGPKAHRIKCAPVPLTKAQLKLILVSFDRNGDNRLSKQELKDAFNYIGSHFPSWRAGRALRRADDNEDGYISEGEMDDLVEYVLQCGYTIS
ncbi:calmodulin-like protein 3 [Herrania umbratica]|uniref:Calmodulin-like protein 3 n=1 Tax=Herrania umbratica TaxID=108875 RepID=A0A6J1ADI3_9ROSI|nr:calmodulin-like protein 3 [Herrania umbratica]